MTFRGMVKRSVASAVGRGVWAALLLWTAGCGPASGPAGKQAEYAVTTSWLECCLRDLAGSEVSVLRVCPPGQCPGHFDISPGMWSELQGCKALFLFDFQKALDEKLSRPGSGPAMTPIPAPQGLCVPARYVEGCAAVRDALVRMEPARTASFDAALETVRKRMALLEEQVRAAIRTAGLSGARVVASGHQAEFCRWLGLDPVVIYSGGDSTGPGELAEWVRQGRESQARFVVGNLQEGRQMGDSLAGQLGVPTVVFSNFPSMAGGQDSFDALVQANVAALVLAAGAHP